MPFDVPLNVNIFNQAPSFAFHGRTKISMLSFKKVVSLALPARGQAINR
jgi:hypothetical protein